MAISRLQFERFTAFKKLEIEFSPGINAIIGGNGCGKTHVLKAVYAACDVAGTEKDFAQKLADVFLPMERNLGRLVHRQRGRARGSVTVVRDGKSISASFSTIRGAVRHAIIKGAEEWAKKEVECAYIPVKEMLSNAPGFISLHASRELHFEDIYADILHRAYRPRLKGPIDAKRSKLLKILREDMEGEVQLWDETFVLAAPEGNLEFPLVSEGLRKLALLWILIQNGTLLKGSVLFWDEPETNLNPTLFGVVVDVLLELQRMGVQVILATHSYVFLKEIQLRRKKSDKVLFHSFYRDEKSRSIFHNSTNDYISLAPNLIADAFDSLYDREVERALGNKGNR